MQVRQRQEAQGSARRSLLIGQAATLALAIFLAVTLLGGEIATMVRMTVATVHVSTPVLILIGSWILLAPIAGWVALRQK